MTATDPHLPTDSRGSDAPSMLARRVPDAADGGERRTAEVSAADIAELRRAKAAAEAANEAKSRYLAAVSHEIRSPLNAIYGYAQLLERGDVVTTAEAGAMIRRSVDHLTNLAESLLEISHIQSGVLKIQSDAVDIRVLLEQVVSMFRAQALDKRLYLRLNLCGNLPAVVKADEKRLRQILINLTSNAIKYTGTGGVDIDVRYRSQVATIEVVDTGIGIDPSEIERVFEPFERGHSAEAQSQPGIGLGLTITRVLAWVLGGEIGVTRRPEGGSRFQLKLMLPPLSTATVDDSPAPRIDSYQGPRRTIMIVEDDPAQATAMQAFLRSLDFAVFCADTGTRGIELAAGCRPDLVLLDVQMPGIDGWETARRLRRAHGSALKIVMTSASAASTTEGQRDDADHDAFLAKPVHFDALLAVVQAQLDLEWNDAAIGRLVEQDRATAAVPPGARPYLRRIRDYARIGHVLGVEQELAVLDQAVPAAAPFVLVLKELAASFDFGSLIKKIEDAGER
ncbi:hybrid sensor histidine kinase/response regulator [Sphingomonas sp. 1P08PE]|uniref:ATP-binding response regulator n=1 Tax=Sphingomonas sp. 1P08PE TaxID=554122 RepID=UPI0039A23AA9